MALGIKLEEHTNKGMELAMKGTVGADLGVVRATFLEVRANIGTVVANKCAFGLT